MRPALALASLLLAATVLGNQAARAEEQLPCTELARIAGFLHETYGETPVSAGLQVDGRLLQIFASSSGSWTVVSANPAGLACVLATGQHWQEVGGTAVGIERPAGYRS